MSLRLRTALAPLRSIPPRTLRPSLPSGPAARFSSLARSRVGLEPRLHPRLPGSRGGNGWSTGGRGGSRRFNSSSSGSSTSNEPPKSAYQRMKEMTKTYGSYAVIMYLALSAVDFSLTFAVVHAVGVQRIEPYLRHVVRWYRVIRHGKEGADALERADEARRLADEAEAAADAAITVSNPPSKQQTTSWWNNKALWAEIALAYSIHKVGLLPVRAGLTVAWTPKVVNWLTRRGWIGTSGAKRAAQHGADKMREAGERALDAAKRGQR